MIKEPADIKKTYIAISIINPTPFLLITSPLQIFSFKYGENNNRRYAIIYAITDNTKVIIALQNKSPFIIINKKINNSV